MEEAESRAVAKMSANTWLPRGHRERLGQGSEESLGSSEDKDVYGRRRARESGES